MPTRDLPTFTGPNLTGELQLDFQPRIVRRDLRVVRAEDITPRYRRIELAGDDLADGFPFVRFSPGDHVKVFFPDPATGTLTAYRDTGDEWELDGDGDPIHRDYTVRAWDPDSRRLTLDFVLHEHGVAGVWARHAQVGDRVVVNGPSANQLLPEDYPVYLAVGDETALPAIARIIEEAPAHSHVIAVVEVANAAEEQDLHGVSGLDLRWVHRDTAPVGEGHLSALETAVRAVALPDDLGGLFVFAAGEAGAMKPIRRYLRHERGVPRRQVEVDGYWKRGATDFDHHDVDIPED